MELYHYSPYTPPWRGQGLYHTGLLVFAVFIVLFAAWRAIKFRFLTLQIYLTLKLRVLAMFVIVDVRIVFDT
jgi:hypothetical protein